MEAEQAALADEVARSTPFGILGVLRIASREEVKKAYRALAKRYHPDRNMGVGQDEAAVQFRRIAGERPLFVSEWG